MSSNDITHCYLCGGLLKGDEPTSRDHIPPRQIFTSEIRKRYEVKFVTRPVHASCNVSYARDEEYFVHCLIPFTRGTEAGNSLFQKVTTEYQRGKNRALVNQVLSQTKTRVGNIILPSNRVALEFDHLRFDRVVSKIVRGLHSVELNQILPQDIRMFSSLTPPGETPPEHFTWFMNNVVTDSLGEHQGVFAYRHHSDPEGVQYWAMLFWDKVLITAMFRTEAPQDDLPALKPSRNTNRCSSES